MHNLGIVSDYINSNSIYTALTNKMDSICDILKNKGINGIVYGASLRLAFSSSSDMETFVDHL